MVRVLEKERLRVGWRSRSLTQLEVNFHFFHHTRREWDESGFEKFGFAKMKCSIFPVNISELKFQRFAESHSRGIEEQDQQVERLGAERGIT
jgi:hypothetical protein